jgi:hypothetical protein
MSEAEKMAERLDNELGWGIGPAMLCQEAAALIRRLQAENETLSKDNKYLLKINQNLQRELTRLETLHYP